MRRDVAIERRRSDAEATHDLSYTDSGFGQHRLWGLDVVVREFRRTASDATRAVARLAWAHSRIRLRSNSANAPARHVKNQPILRGR